MIGNEAFWGSESHRLPSYTHTQESRPLNKSRQQAMMNPLRINRQKPDKA